MFCAAYEIECINGANAIFHFNADVETYLSYIVYLPTFIISSTLL